MDIAVKKTIETAELTY